MKESEELSAQQMETMTVGDLVASDYRTAEVFEKYGIDFCCGGKVAIKDICREKGINAQELFGDLAKVVGEEPMDRSQNYGTWELPFLADYIVNTHHSYLKENMSGIAAYANKIAQVHGAHHPEVIRIAEIFDKIAADMTLHLHEEEDLFFPTVKKMIELKKAGGSSEGDAEKLRETLKTLTHEHEEIGDAIHEIRRLSKDYAIPGDVCNTFMLTYRKLKEFEDDLHKHVHLENNILFPKAAKL